MQRKLYNDVILQKFIKVKLSIPVLKASNYNYPKGYREKKNWENNLEFSKV